MAPKDEDIALARFLVPPAACALSSSISSDMSLLNMSDASLAASDVSLLTMPDVSPRRGEGGSDGAESLDGDTGISS